MIILDTLRYAVSFLSMLLYCAHYLEMRRKLNQHARRDIFTGLYNKVFFSRAVQKWIDRGDPFCLFILDIDDFKSINDTYGHMVGDDVILHLAHSLEEICPIGTMISRFGGDEFVFAQRDTNEEKFAPWLDQLQDLRYKATDGTCIKFTVSIGVCESSDFTQYEKIYRKADECLYVSKKLGKGRYTLYSPSNSDYSQMRMK